MSQRVMELLGAINNRNYAQLFWWERETDSPWGVVFQIPDLKSEFERSAIQVVLKQFIPEPVPFYIEALGFEVPETGKDRRIAGDWNSFLEWLRPFHTPKDDGWMSFPFLDLAILSMIYHGEDLFVLFVEASKFLRSVVFNANRVYLEEPKNPFEECALSALWALDYFAGQNRLYISIPSAAQNANTAAALSKFALALKKRINIEVEWTVQG